MWLVNKNLATFPQWRRGSVHRSLRSASSRTCHLTVGVSRQKYRSVRVKTHLDADGILIVDAARDLEAVVFVDYALVDDGVVFAGNELGCHKSSNLASCEGKEGLRRQI